MRFNAPLLLALSFATAAPALAETAFDGPYIGAMVGLQAHSQNRARTEGTPGFLALPGAVRPDFQDLRFEDGWQGSGVAGYNFSSGKILYGVEGDFTIGNVKGANSFVGAPIPGLAPQGLTTNINSRLGNRASLRARLGYTFGDKLLAYTTAGIAVGDTRAAAAVLVNGTPGASWFGEAEGTQTGYTVGGGLEYKLTKAVALRAEYLFTDFGKQRVTATGNAAVRGIAALNGIDYAVAAPNRAGAARVGVTIGF
jgi:outer membrane immunogenic protein